MFRQVFTIELQKLRIDNLIIDQLWDEINLNYNNANRHYHNINHLNHLSEHLLHIKQEIEDWSTMVFSIAYHDVVYDIMRSDNEEQSAIFAYERLTFLEQLLERKERCKEQILATKGHQRSENSDTNYFIDADLSILGSDWDSYSEYAKQIREEFKQYKDADYRTGRAAVLNHFLKMKTIFKTDLFQNKLEEKARINIKKELKLMMNGNP
jgi:predicted metal-dependent HD superfamily phosphohydrolase